MGEFGAWRKGSELWGQLHREERRWGKGYGGRETEVKGRDAVSFKFENLRGEKQRQRGGKEVSGEERRGMKRRGEEVRRGELRRRELRRGGER